MLKKKKELNWINSRLLAQASTKIISYRHNQNFSLFNKYSIFLPLQTYIYHKSSCIFKLYNFQLDNFQINSSISVSTSNTFFFQPINIETFINDKNQVPFIPRMPKSTKYHKPLEHLIFVSFQKLHHDSYKFFTLLSKSQDENRAIK